MKEIERFNKATLGTKVWRKRHDSTSWVLSGCVNWLFNFDYIVDDEYAEVRKFFADNGYIWCNTFGRWSIDKDNIFTSPIHHFRINEPLYGRM